MLNILLCETKEFILGLPTTYSVHYGNKELTANKCIGISEKVRRVTQMKDNTDRRVHLRTWLPVLNENSKNLRWYGACSHLPITWYWPLQLSRVAVGMPWVMIYNMYGICRRSCQRLLQHHVCPACLLPCSLPSWWWTNFLKLKARHQLNVFF